MRNVTALLGRVLISAIFIQAGFGKLIRPEAAIASVARLHMPVPKIAWMVVMAVELGGGLLILVGHRARPVAVAMAVYCLVLALAAHYIPEDRGQMIHFMQNIAIAGGFLQIAAFGPGNWSLGRG